MEQIKIVLRSLFPSVEISDDASVSWLSNVSSLSFAPWWVPRLKE